MHVVSILAVDCGASHVACGRFSAGPDRLALEHFASRLLPASDLNEDDWVAAVGSALQKLQRTERLRGECVLGLPGHLTFHRLLRVPRVTARQRRKIIEFEQCQGMPTAAGEMIWSQAPVTETEGGQELILAAAKRRIVEKLGAQVRGIGLFPCAVLPAWLVLRQAIVCCPPTAGDALVLAVGARSSHLVLCGRDRFFARTIALGGNMITQKLAEDLQLDFQSAEALKLQGFAVGAELGNGQRERKAGQMALDQFVRRLCAEIQRSPPLALPADDPARPTALFLTGGGARLRELPGALTERLQLQVERWDLQARTGSGQASADPDRQPDDGRFADLIGLAASAARARHAKRGFIGDGWKRVAGVADPGLPTVASAKVGPASARPAATRRCFLGGMRTEAEGNLLSRPFRRELFVRRRWPWLAGAALIGIIGGLYPIWRWRMKACEVRRQITEVDAGIADLRRVDTRNRANLERLAEARRRIFALRRLAAARSGWVALLGDLQAQLAMVQDAWIDRLQILPSDDRRRSRVAGTAAAGLAGDPVAEPRPAPAARAAAPPRPASSEAVVVPEAWRGGATPPYNPDRIDAGEPSTAAGAAESADGARVQISGSMFDAVRPVENAGEEIHQKAATLLAAFRGSPLVCAVEREHFDDSQPGLLRFEVTLRLTPHALH